MSAKTRWIGRSTPRREDLALITGKGRFVDDIAPAGCLFIAFLRSAHAHARITTLNVEPARLSEHVADVLTADEIDLAGGLSVNPILDGIDAPAVPVLAGDVVTAVGQPIVAIVADSPIQAQDALERIEIDFDILDPIVENGPKAFEKTWRAGDPDDAFARADHVVEVEINHPRLHALAVEPRAMLARYDSADDWLTIYISSQTPHRARTDLATILGHDLSKVRVVAPDVGGAFGMKASLYPEDVVTAFAARRLKAPVKWTSSRCEDMMAATNGRGGRVRGMLALSKNGRFQGLRAEIDCPLGHWLTFSAAVPAWNAGRILPGGYAIDSIEIITAGHRSHTAPVGIYRGAGRPEAAMLMERLVDRAANVTGLDPMEIRRANLRADVRSPEPTPTGATLDSGRYLDCLDRLLDLADYNVLREQRDERRKSGDITGIGLAFYVEPCGQGWESATVRLEADGRITAATGTSAQGQGRETAFAQIVADIMGIEPAQVTVVEGDTDRAPRGIGALASRSTPIGGAALARAARSVLENAKSIASRRLNVSANSLTSSPGGLFAEDGVCLSWLGIAAIAMDTGDGDLLSAHIVHHAEGEAWGYGCSLAAVSIDRDTGVLTVERMFWVDDAGPLVNPMLAKGQLVGGMAQGLGESVMERLVYNEDGQILTASLMDYAVPRAGDVPPIIIGTMETPSPYTEYGFKGVGEAGSIGTQPAIVNAVLDALSPFGVDTIDMPLTSERLWRAMQAGEKEQELQ